MADKNELSDIDSEGVYMMSIEEFQARPKPKAAAAAARDASLDTPSSDWATRKPGHSPTDVEARPAR